MRIALAIVLAAFLLLPASLRADDPPHPLKQWVKRHPTAGKKDPVPRLGYEGSYGYDPVSRLLIHYGGHNQGGGGEQNSEIWTYDLDKDIWKHLEPNDCPPGVCCAQQNVFHDRLGKFVRFPAFSGSHGWQSGREIALKDSSVWTYDLPTNTWTPMRPVPEIRPSPLRGAAYDPESDLIVLHGGEGSQHGTVAYDLHTNTWRKLNSKNGPSASLSQPGFTYDSVNKVFVLFGSQFADDPKTYLYDLKADAWGVLETKDHPPADKTSPILCADTRNGVVVCSVRAAKEKEGEKADLQTWVLDVKQATWTKLDIPQPDPSGSRNRILTYLEDSNLFVLENNTNSAAGREQQIWTFRYAEAAKPVAKIQPTRKEPALPQTPVLSCTDAKTIALTWPASKDPSVAGYVVERAPIAVYSSQQAARVAKRYPEASDQSVGTVRAVGEFKPLTDKPIAETRFADTSIDLMVGQKEVPSPSLAGRELKGESLVDGKPYRFATYAFRVRAVNKDGVSSGPSPAVYSWPAAVQNLRAKEEGLAATRLKWDASPAKDIVGYHVYRHDGRYEKDPIVRLTPKPIAGTEFLDEQSGKNARRYEVVAVDALGQEGEPTTPVWSRREYRSYYLPFTGDWHQ